MEKSSVEVDWTNDARNDLWSVFEYWRHRIGAEKADALVNKLIDKSLLLERFPELGTIDEELSNRYATVRYLVEGYYKIHYTYDRQRSRVKVRGIWDTRQDPGKLLQP